MGGGITANKECMFNVTHYIGKMENARRPQFISIICHASVLRIFVRYKNILLKHGAYNSQYTQISDIIKKLKPKTSWYA